MATVWDIRRSVLRFYSENKLAQINETGILDGEKEIKGMLIGRLLLSEKSIQQQCAIRFRVGSANG